MQRVVGNYEIERLLGRGGMARVWLARHRILDVRRALKELRHPGLVARHLREGQLQARLSHRNLLPVLDVVQEGPVALLVMEHVDGPDLSELIALRPLTLAEIDALAVGMLEGLRAAHAAGVVHRDLKPHNVLLACEGSQLVPRIGDFGIAKVQDVEITDVGQSLGTPRYMAPEQLDDASTVDARADLFSMGCMLYELLTGHTPFPGADPVTVLQRMRAGDFEPLPQVRPDTPVRMVEAVHRCLDPDPDARPPDCDALLALLAPAPGVLALTEAELATLRASRERRLAAVHLDDERLLERSLDPWEEHHLAGCVRCQVEREELFACLSEAEPGPTLVGRGRELTTLRAQLDAGARLITVKGPGGAGKTTLAREVARTWPGRSWFCDLTHVRRERDEHDPFGTVSGLQEALAGSGRRLVVLDNCEQIVDLVAHRVRAWLDSRPGLTIVTTSRERLNLQDEQVFELGPLQHADAVTLFVRLARAATPDLPVDGYADDIGRIVDRLDRLPLAIDLAAARVRAMTPTAILERLERRFDLLAGGPRDRSRRQATLRGALDWSWDLLTPAEQQALAQLGVFHGPFALDAAEAVLDLPPDAPWALDVLTSLVDKSLVRHEDGAYHLLESVRAYAADKLGGGEACARRHLAWYSASPACPRDLPNLVQAARRAIVWADDDAAASLALKIGTLLTA